MGARRFQDLDTWQVGRELRIEVDRLSGLPAMSREFSLQDQLRTAAGSVCTNIAEGFGRRSHADFARFLVMASSSALDVENHLIEATDRQILTCDQTAVAAALIHRARAALASLTTYLRRTPSPDE